MAAGLHWPGMERFQLPSESHPTARRSSCALAASAGFGVRSVMGVESPIRAGRGCLPRGRRQIQLQIRRYEDNSRLREPGLRNELGNNEINRADPRKGRHRVVHLTRVLSSRINGPRWPTSGSPQTRRDALDAFRLLAAAVVMMARCDRTRVPGGADQRLLRGHRGNATRAAWSSI